jgi:hypothetical protein
MYSFVWRINCSNPGYIRITFSKIEPIPYNEIFTTKFTDSSILTTITCIYMKQFEIVVCEWICWWCHNTNPGYQV